MNRMEQKRVSSSGSMVFIELLVANSQRAKFTLRMSHIGRELELFVRWGLHLLFRTWPPTSFTVDTKQSRLSWTRVLLSARWSVLKILWEMLNGWKALPSHLCLAPLWSSTHAGFKMPSLSVSEEDTQYLSLSVSISFMYNIFTLQWSVFVVEL